MRNIILGKRYATALLDIASSDEEVEQYGADLKTFAGLMEQVPELRKVLTVPLYSREIRASSLAEICEQSGASPVFTGFLKVILEKGRFAQFEDIVKAYSELLDERQGRVHATIFSAKSLSEQELEKIATGLAKRLGKAVVVSSEVDTGLLGGIRAQVGSMVIDDSIRSQLSQVKDRLVKG